MLRNRRLGSPGCEEVLKEAAKAPSYRIYSVYTYSIFIIVYTCINILTKESEDLALLASKLQQLGQDEMSIEEDEEKLRPPLGSRHE